MGGQSCGGGGGGNGQWGEYIYIIYITHYMHILSLMITLDISSRQRFTANATACNSTF